MYTLIDRTLNYFNWVKSFLTKRKQRVKLVPRGTVLGPVLFLVVINYMLDEWRDRWKYADDSTAVESVMPNYDSKLQDLVNYIHN